MRKVYGARARMMGESLKRELGDAIAFTQPARGRSHTALDVHTVVDARTELGGLILKEGLAAMPNVKRHLEAINARPAAQRAEALKERFTFKQEMDEEAKRAMFPQNARLVAG